MTRKISDVARSRLSKALSILPNDLNDFLKDLSPEESIFFNGLDIDELNIFYLVTKKPADTYQSFQNQFLSIGMVKEVVNDEYLITKKIDLAIMEMERQIVLLNSNIEILSYIDSKYDKILIEFRVDLYS